jgi:acyl carrier protein
MNDAVIKQKLQHFISDTFIKGQTNTKLIDSDSFFENDIIDSTGVLELVLFIEETFGFRVEDEEIIPENLDSINRLVAYVNSKLTKS